MKKSKAEKAFFEELNILISNYYCRCTEEEKYIIDRVCTDLAYDYDIERLKYKFMLCHSFLEQRHAL